MDRYRDRRKGRGHGRLVPQVGVSRTEIGHVSRVLCAGRAVKCRRIQQRCAGEAIEIEPRVELARAADPFCAKGNRIFAAVHYVAVVDEGGLTVVAHVLRAAGGDEAQHFVAGLIGIADDLAMVIADDAPFVRAGVERAVLDQLHRRCARRFDDADVVEQDFALVEQAHYKFVPLSVGPDRARRRDAAIGIRVPRGAAALVAGGPRLARGIVSPRVTQFDARAASVGGFGPASVVEIVDYIRRVIGSVLQYNALARVGKLIRERPDDRDARKIHEQRRRILGHDEIAAGRNDSVRREAEVDAFVEPPAGEVHCIVGAIE